jgi:hypothetical protein
VDSTRWGSAESTISCLNMLSHPGLWSLSHPETRRSVTVFPFFWWIRVNSTSFYGFIPYIYTLYKENINKSWAFLVIHALFDDTPRPVPQRNFGPRARRSGVPPGSFGVLQCWFWNQSYPLVNKHRPWKSPIFNGN